MKRWSVFTVGDPILFDWCESIPIEELKTIFTAVFKSPVHSLFSLLATDR